MQSSFSLIKVKTRNLWLILLISLSTSSFGVQYNVVAGSMIIVQEVNQSLPTGSNGVRTVDADYSQYLPLLGGFATVNGVAVAPDNIQEIDGWKGVRVNPNNIIAGFSGRISGGEVTVRNANNHSEQQRFTGGLLFDNKGHASALGDVLPSSAALLTGGFIAPYRSDVAANTYSGPDNQTWGNKLATVNGRMWIYVPESLAPGVYPLSKLLVSQGPGHGVFSSLSLIAAGDSVRVIPPPCTINTQSHIVFDTHSPNGEVVNEPLTYTCNTLDGTSAHDAYLVVTAISKTYSPTELALTIDGDKVGGRVRGYFNALPTRCTDSEQSIMFDGQLHSKIGHIVSGTQEHQLFWQLCRQGDEGIGEAKGSAILELSYK